MESNLKYKGWNFLEQKWEDIDKETYDTLLDPARCIVPSEVPQDEKVKGDNQEVGEKAKELFEKFLGKATQECEHDSYCCKPECEYNKTIYCCVNIDIAKQCAIICVDEILKIVPMYTGNINPDWQFWQQVHNHITNL